MSDENSNQRINHLYDEKGKLWERVLDLEKDLERKTNDSEKEAKQSSRKAAEYRNKSEARFNEANELFNEIVLLQETIKEKAINVQEEHDRVLQKSSEIYTQGKNLAEIITTINAVLEKYPDLENDVLELDGKITSIDESNSKATSTYKGILSKKTEIDELHREIIGYEDEDEDGQLVEVEGLKSELSSAYKGLKEQSTALEIEIEKIETTSVVNYSGFIDKHSEELKDTKTNATKEYDEINKKIESLLPNALTAGLSSAFITKKAEEEQQYSEYKERFRKGITSLTVASFLPIAVSIFFLATGSSLTDVIERSPKVIFSFLPLYIPLIWVTISANKKVNLSKRLIEEYSHKQVLSMTIEGLSKQIENIEDSALSEELRVKLLSSFLDVTNENPGKLISNYQKSDNPILNILDRDKKDTSEQSIVETMTKSTKKIIEKATEEVKGNIENES